MLRVFLVFLFSLFLSVDAIASEGIAAVSAATDYIMNHLMGSAVIIGVVLEAVLRLFKSEKPRSILLVIAVVSEQLGKFFAAVAKFLHSVLPQRLK